MGFGNENTLRLKRPSFRQKVIQDMIGVAEGRVAGRPNLINDFNTNSMNVPSISHDGNIVAVVGQSYVGDGDVVGVRRKVEVI